MRFLKSGNGCDNIDVDGGSNKGDKSDRAAQATGDIWLMEEKKGSEGKEGNLGQK